MQRRRVPDPWLLDAYRTSCTLKGRLPKRWLEQRLLQIPPEVKWLSLKLTPPEDQPALTQREMSALVQILFQSRDRQKSQPIRKELPTALPLAAALAQKRKQNAQFVIPGMQKSSMQPPQNGAVNEMVSLPLRSLELGGEGVTPLIIQELRFWCLQLSHRCTLSDLIIRASTQQPHEQDFVSCLSLCSPLRRSLRRLVIQNSPSFRILCEFSWALFFGTTPLEHLTLEDTGMSSADFAFLCEILCDNEMPQSCLEVLKLKSASSVGAAGESAFSEMEFVSVKRCLSMLKKLQHFEINNLTPEQRKDLIQEWRALKGEVPVSILSAQPASSVKLSLLSKETYDGLERDVAFEEIPSVGELLICHPVPTKSISGVVSGFTLSRTSHTTKRPQPATNIQKLPLRRRPHQRTLPSFQDRARESEEGTSVMSTAERLWEKFKPPPGSLVSAHHQQGHQERSTAGTTRGYSRARRTMPLEFYFQSQDDDATEAPSEESLDLTSDDSPVTREDPERRKRPRFRQASSPNADTGPSAKRPSERSIHPESFIYEMQGRSDGEDVELLDEKCYGPPPGGRKVELRDMEADPDLMGYLSDGFIRPDDELVYTTSASDEEIEQDLSVLRGAGRRMVPLSSSDSEEEADVAKTEPEPELHEEMIMLESDGVTEIKQNYRERTSSGRDLTLTALEKELQELQAFYYDKNRERYQPGQFFDCETSSQEARGVTLRSGRHIQPSSDPISQAAVPCPSESIREHRAEEIIDEPSRGPRRAENAQSPRLEQPLPQEGEDETGGHRKDMKRVGGSREARRLQFWAWDHNFEKFPPNEDMYFSHADRRQGKGQDPAN